MYRLANFLHLRKILQFDMMYKTNETSRNNNKTIITYISVFNSFICFLLNDHTHYYFITIHYTEFSLY